MFRKKELTIEQKKEYAQLLNKWETEWGNMTNDEVRRFLALERMVNNEKKKVECE